MLRRTLGSMLLVLAAVAGAARAAPDPKPAPVKVTPPAGAVDLPAGGEATVRLHLEVEPKLHVYAENKEDFIPLTFESADPALQVKSVRLPAPHIADLLGQKVPVYEGALDADVVLAGGAGWPEGERKVDIVVGYQACSDKFCLDPMKRPVEVPVRVVAGGPAATNASSGAVSGPTTPVGSTSAKAGAPARRGFLLEIGAALLIGLASTLLPCVYPLIPVTISFFDQQGGSRAKAVPLALAYGAGIVSLFAPLGVVSALAGQGMGDVLGNPYFAWFFALLFVLLALSLFGFYDLQLPMWLTSRLHTERGGALGAYLLGFFLGFLAAPCTGPFTAGLMTVVAQTRDVVFGLLTLGAFGLGIALPFMVLGIFSAGLSTLPRAGEWMDHVKHFFGYVLLAFAINFVFVATGSETLVFALLGAWFLVAGAAAQRSELVLARALAVALIAAGLYVGFGPYVLQADGPIVRPDKLFASKIDWVEDHDAALAKAKANGKPAFVDFTARWCNACHELDFTAWRDPAVVAEARRFVAVKLDVTTDAHNQKIKTEVYNPFAIPYIAFYDSTGKLVASLPREGASGITTEDVLNTLKEIH
jgi:thiol:disulfide interchange protein DsbD